MEQDRGTLGTMLMGALAGAAGVWMMDRVDWFMTEHGDQEAWRQTQRVRPEHKDPAHRMVSMAARAAGFDAPPQPHWSGIGMHYAIGVMPAAIYALQRHRLPGGPAKGMVYGLALALIQDEALGAASGATAPLQDYPKQAHIRGLVAHLVYGLVTELVLSAADRSLERPSHRRRASHGRHRDRPDRAGADGGWPLPLHDGAHRSSRGHAQHAAM